MGVVVVIDELGDCLVVTASEHARRSLFWGEFLGVSRFVGRVGWVGADHLLIFTNANALPL